MARARRGTADQHAETLDESLDQINAILAKMGGEDANAQFYVYRMPTEGEHKEWMFLFQFSAEEFDFGELMEKLRDNPRFGTGLYRLQLRVDGAIHKNVKFGVEGVPRMVPGASPTADIVAVQEKASRAQQDTMLMMLQMMQNNAQQQMAQSQQQMQLMMQSSQQNMQMMLGMMQALKPQQTDPVQMIAALKQLTPEPSKGGMAEFRENFAFFRELMPDGAPEDGGLDFKGLISSAVPLLIGAAQKANATPQPEPIRQQVRVQQPQRAAIPAPAKPAAPAPTEKPAAEVAPNPAAKPAPTKEEANMIRLIHALRAIAPTILIGAQRDADPRTYAELLSDAIPEGLEEQALQLLDAPDWHQTLIQFMPQLAGKEEWLNQVKDEFLALGSEEDEEEVEPLEPDEG